MLFLNVMQTSVSSVELPLLSPNSIRELKIRKLSFIGKWFCFHQLSLISELWEVSPRRAPEPCLCQGFGELPFFTYSLLDSEVKSLGLQPVF